MLHDLGAISAIGSDSQGMGRIGETIARTWQVAAHMKAERGSLPEDRGRGHDNERIKRYVAKYTINPALIYGIAHEIGSIEAGKLADLAVLSADFFDPRQVPDESIRTMRSVLTIVDGRVVHDALR